jgi:hydroxyacid-oxoacid transhydrogenase
LAMAGSYSREKRFRTMSCCHHYYALAEGCEQAFSVDMSSITVGPGCLLEAGAKLKARGIKRVAVFTDKRVRQMPFFAGALRSLEQASLDLALYDGVQVEPSDASFQEAAGFAMEARPDAYLSIGGGSVMDTCKAANLYATHPADFLAYVNAPVGEGREVPGPLKPHIACPTTCGTGSECTGIAVFDLPGMKAKTGIASRHLRPSEALVDPECTRTLPHNVLAASAFDVLSHAAESYTAIPYSARPAAPSPGARPMSQGANPWSDMGCERALKILGRYFERALLDPDDWEAREQIMWAATLAGIAFGNAGVHLPHGMSYAVAGQVRDFHVPDYPQDHPLVPHGMSVIVNAPAVFRYTASACPDRHLVVAGWLGADISRVAAEEAGEVLAAQLESLMKTGRFPGGLGAIGYSENDLDALTDGAMPQQRLLCNSPLAVDRSALKELFRSSLSYW